MTIKSLRRAAPRAAWCAKPPIYRNLAFRPILVDSYLAAPQPIARILVLVLVIVIVIKAIALIEPLQLLTLGIHGYDE
ncbi:MAG: hypothetical protein M1457_10415 [bacterium]|nr:hypothetical protein [bacterium]